MTKKTQKDKAKVPGYLGQYPFPPEKKRPLVLKSEDAISRIYGHKGHPVPTWLHVSTDNLSCTEFELGPGDFVEPPDIHTGDEVYFIISGQGTLFNPDNGQILIVSKGDCLYIPKGTWHQIHNFSDRRLKIICFFAPSMWSDDERGTSIDYDGKPAYFKPSGG